MVSIGSEQSCLHSPSASLPNATHPTNHSQVQSPSPLSWPSAAESSASPLRSISLSVNHPIIANFSTTDCLESLWTKTFLFTFYWPVLIKFAFYLLLNHHHPSPLTTGCIAVLTNRPHTRTRTKFIKHGNGTPAVLELQQLQRLRQFQSSKW